MKDEPQKAGRAETAEAAARINELIAAHGEWLYFEGAVGRAVALRRSECDVRVSHGQLIFSCWSETGARIWRVESWKWTGERLLLEARRRAGAVRCTLELVPRASASRALLAISDNRRALCERLAQLALEHLRAAKAERVGLSAGASPRQPGRYARIILQRGAGERLAVTGIVAGRGEGEADALLSSTLIWYARLRESAIGPTIRQLCLLLERPLVEAVAERLALLKESLRRDARLYLLDGDWQGLAPVECPTREQLWQEKPPRLHVFTEKPLSEPAASIIARAPDAIDAVRARHGETLRFHGLPFARVRRVMNRERVWFGTHGSRHLLEESTRPAWLRLLDELREHRRADAADHAHALYRAAPEAWLESILRRDITRLDPGLVISPLHAQFRTRRTAARRATTRPLDLLALRRDGRLAVVELKVAEDRQHVLQGADYFRRVEAHRRHGHLAHARLFPGAHLADAPPLVYLVAPMLRFHRAFDLLARSVSPEIAIYRFAINEDWRAGVRTVQRCDLKE